MTNEKSETELLKSLMNEIEIDEIEIDEIEIDEIEIDENNFKSLEINLRYIDRIKRDQNEKLLESQNLYKESQSLYKETIIAEQQLMNLFFLNNKLYPLKDEVIRALGSITGAESTILRIALSKDPSYRNESLHGRLHYRYVSSKVDFSETWVSTLFNRGLRKLKHPSRSRKLKRYLSLNKEFLKWSSLDKSIVTDYLKENFYFETNLLCWVFGIYHDDIFD